MKLMITAGASALLVAAALAAVFTATAERAAEIRDSLASCVEQVDELFPEPQFGLVDAPAAVRQARLRALEERAGFLEACFTD